jgi:hypothetical protein
MRSRGVRFLLLAALEEETEMPVRRVEYKGMAIRVGAFEVGSLGRFMPTLTIERVRESQTVEDAKLFNPPCPHDLFETSEEALRETIVFGMAIIDGEVDGLTIEDI